ncbi:hypothetical protein CcCBS67573_g03366 [Chytriomyces confervae]|uniref:Uncharacterized protein n=1 Tax=Chytriomyces confervae TaxID=246404 RepID=A0A507FJ11_9FUNG|nr:hypothetical protein HDU80_008896 [Chytriomyces hyalinus]TPX75378.1 hypothetical protein CcCBS67573_g03366 [Chytriomyces confervae]
MLAQYALLLASATATLAAGVPYHNGPVVSNIEITAIFYGRVPYQTTVTDYYAQITDSVYMDWLTEFNTPSQRIGRGRLVTSFNETTNIKTRLTDSTDVHDYLISLIKAGKITPNNNSYFAIHFQQGINIDYCYVVNGQNQCGSTCSEYGAWHSFIDLSKYGISVPGVPYLYYGVMPDCGSGFDAVAASHEVIETISDPAGDNPALAAWCDTNDLSGGEIADKCGTSGKIVGSNGKSYTVATGWSNTYKKCIYAPVASATTSKSKTIASASTTTASTNVASSSRVTTASKTASTGIPVPSGPCSTYYETKCAGGNTYLCYYWSGGSLTWKKWQSGC